MGLITETVKIKWNPRNKKYYESFGYIYTKMGDEFEVKIEHLTKGSDVKVRCKCDGCNKDLIWNYNGYCTLVKEDGNTYCQVCGTNLSKNGVASFKSFYDWCLESKRNDILLRWDYELNKCSPKEVTYSTSKKYWFKCDKHQEHESELKQISSFINGHEGSIVCNQCNSIAQYILDNFPNKDLYDIWDKEKNKKTNPWKITKKSNKKIWITCQEKDYHGAYEIICSSFANGRRCPYCVNMKVHKKDSLGQYIIDNYGEDFLRNIWSDKNNTSPFDLSPNSTKKIWWECPDGKHEKYLRTCNGSLQREFRCPKCVEEMNNSVIEEKTKTYLVELGYEVLTEHNCTIRPINPKTKKPMPYDNEIILFNGKHLIIEVHGGQHYEDSYYKAINKCSDEEAEKMLKQRKLYDRYKKAYAEHCGYNYLELPYWAFIGKNKETYKQMIDEKIEEILHNTKAS